MLHLPVFHCDLGSPFVAVERDVRMAQLPREHPRTARQLFLAEPGPPGHRCPIVCVESCRAKVFNIGTLWLRLGAVEPRSVSE